MTRFYLYIALFTSLLQATPYTVIKTNKKGSSHFIWLKDQQNNHYLAKQKTQNICLQLRLIAETIATQIAQSTGVIIPDMQLLLPGHNLPECNNNFPATLQTIAPGIIVQRHPIHSKIRLNQWAYNKKKEVNPHLKGLTHEIITNMSKHNSLPPIIALDTFVGNCDRHNKNILYDDDLDIFTAIDMDDAFQREITQAAIDRLSHISSITHLEREALISYTNTLQTLYDSWPADKIIQSIESYCSMIDLFNTESNLYSTMQKKNREYKTALRLKKQLCDNITTTMNLIPYLITLTKDLTLQ